jgi:catechol 2,3-dioxygenase-like lactoylglutathione lyase family enzyme
MKLSGGSLILKVGCLALLASTVISNARTGKENVRMINKSTPILHVKSVEPSLKFWTERFGFKPTIQVPEGNHIGFVALENGPVELMYQTYEGMQVDQANPLAKDVEKGPSFIFMEVPDINAVSKSLDGAQIVQGLHETFYGSKEVVAREPGGHFVIFSQLPTQPPK